MSISPVTAATADAYGKEPADRKSATEAHGHVRGSSLLLVGRFIAVLLNFGVQVLTVRYLSKEGYGAFAYALGVASMCTSIILLGMGKALPRVVPIEIERQQYARAFGNVAIAFGVVVGFGLALILLLHGYTEIVGDTVQASPLSLSLLLILIVMAPIDALDHLLQQLAAVFGKPRTIFFRRQVMGPALKLLAILVVIVASGDAYLLAAGYLAGGFIGIWLYIVVLWRVWSEQGLLQHLHPRRLAWPVRELLGQSVPLLSSEFLVIWRTSLAVVMLEYFHATTTVAEYRAVLPLAGLNMVVFEAFNFLFVPNASRMYARGDYEGVGALYWKTSAWIAVLTFPVIAVTSSLAQPVTVTLFGERYAAAGTVLAILAVGFYANAATGFNSATLRVFGKVRTIVTADMLAMAAAVGLSLLLIPRYGVIGAAIGTTSGLVCQNLLSHVGLAFGTGVRLFEWLYIRLYLLIIGSLVALWAIQRFAALPLGVTLALVGLASLVVLRASRHVIDPLTFFPELRRVPLARQLLS